jgi:hypothetical protein
MGWTVLYIAFGVVALWLLGEVLLQYKARLRWRLLAFAGFSTVVIGVVALSSVVVIALGAMAFAVGQTFVTLSYRRGFSTGWALGGMPGSSRRRRDGAGAPDGEDAEPVLEVSGLEEHRPDAYEEQGRPGSDYVQQGPDGYDAVGYDSAGYDVPADDAAGYGPPSYAPQPTGDYDAYDRDEPSPFMPAAAAQQGGAGDFGQGGTYGYEYGYGGQEQHQHQYASYSDPYIGYDTGQYDGTGPDGYATGSGYGVQPGYGDAGGYADTGYGGVQDGYGGAWVPQQREPEQQPVPEQSYPYQDPYGTGGYGDDALGNGYGYGYPAARQGYENGYPATGYGDGNGNGYGYGSDGQGYDTTVDGYHYDEQRGY